MYYEDAINKMRTPLVARLAMLERTCVLVLRKCSAAVAQFECNSFDDFGQIPKRSSVPPARIWSIVERGSKFYSPFWPALGIHLDPNTSSLGRTCVKE
jgi:hypothetical protein